MSKRKGAGSSKPAEDKPKIEKRPVEDKATTDWVVFNTSIKDLLFNPTFLVLLAAIVAVALGTNYYLGSLPDKGLVDRAVEAEYKIVEADLPEPVTTPVVTEIIPAPEEPVEQPKDTAVCVIVAPKDSEGLRLSGIEHGCDIVLVPSSVNSCWYSNTLLKETVLFDCRNLGD